MSGLWGKTRLDESPWDSQLWLGVVEAATVPAALLAPRGGAGLGWARAFHSCHSK